MMQAAISVVASLAGGAILGGTVIAALSGAAWPVVSLAGATSILFLALGVKMGLSHPWAKGEQ